MSCDFKRLLRFLRPFKWWVLLAVGLGFATLGSSVGLMATSAYIIAKAALHPSIATLQLAIVGVRFFGLSRGVFRYLERYVSHEVTFRLLAELRVWFYGALEPLAPAHLMQYRSGDLYSRLIADIETLEQFYGQVIAPPLVAVLMMVLIGGFMAVFNLYLALITLFFLLLAGLGVPLLIWTFSRGTGQALVNTRAVLNVALIDSIQGMADLLLANREKDQQNRMQRLSWTLNQLQERMVWLSGLHMALSGLLVNGATLAILLIAIPLINQGSLDGVYLALLVLAAMASFEAVLPLAETMPRLEGSLAAARRLFEVVDVEPPISEPVGASPIPGDYSLVVQNLQFGYQEGEPPALKNLSFNLPEGKRLAIVGSSGAGKSTLIKLLLRFWDYKAGHIYLGGHELRDYASDEVRQLMSVVAQETHLFNGTIRDNLRFARPGASEVELVEAARKACLHEFIQALPQGYETWIGEQGLKLSGGERQRLAIARALLKNAPFLILDEPTTHLDSLVEQDILQELRGFMASRTTLMITHRLAGLEMMDEILVLHEGRVVECGSHAELLQAEGIYWRMWRSQNHLENIANSGYTDK
jgi:thiol reductant ABC exporter CydC subunit